MSDPTSNQPSYAADTTNDARTPNIFASIPGLYGLPDKDGVEKNTTLNTKNIQCDILVGMTKKWELFLFFEIEDAPTFKQYLRNFIIPKITSVKQALSVSTQPSVALNIAFAQRGLHKLGISDNVQDEPYTKGQAADASHLGDPGTTNWVPEFASDKIDGVFLLISYDPTIIEEFKEQLFTTNLPIGITKVYELQGHIREAPYAGHEMFGYLDGIGQPAVSGFIADPNPGQQVVEAGIIITGEEGDTLRDQRPAWMLDGSFLVFRQLKQLVPEFDRFLLDNAPLVPGSTQQQNADRLGARIMGRWKSGTPVDISPDFDNGIGADPRRNNNFNYDHPPASIYTNVRNCPFAAHTRKMRPRADLSPESLRVAIRAGIPYGSEVTPAEAEANTTSPDLERGLAYVSYQSQIAEGFRLLQIDWANHTDFAPQRTPEPGFDVISGQNNGGPRWISGTDPNDPMRRLDLLTEFVISRGGEYFFSPSIDALTNTLSGGNGSA